MKRFSLSHHHKERREEEKLAGCDVNALIDRQFLSKKKFVEEEALIEKSYSKPTPLSTLVLVEEEAMIDRFRSRDRDYLRLMNGKLSPTQRKQRQKLRTWKGRYVNCRRQWKIEVASFKFHHLHATKGRKVISEEYSLEYGTDKIEMHVGAVEPCERAINIE